MELVRQELCSVALGNLKEHPRNPRRGDVALIVKSIEVNGWYGAVVAQRSTGYILAGNHRYRAAIAKRMEKIPVLWLDIDDEHALKILLADNRASDVATYDDECLKILLQEILECKGSLEGTGYETDDLDRLLKELGENALAEPGSDQSSALRDLFCVLIECDGERQQVELLERLGKEGYRCRALVA